MNKLWGRIELRLAGAFRSALWAGSILLLLLGPLSGLAHEVRPAYLELRQTASETYEVLWKVPGRGENLRLGLYVELPPECTKATRPVTLTANNAFIERWTTKCPGGLAGKAIHIAGLNATVTDVLARVERLDGTTQVTRLTPSAPTFLVTASARTMDVVGTYCLLGIEHILSGIDHLLFILALLLITGRGWNLVKTVSAFTLSHSITLTLAALGYIHVPQKPVEAVIALSIVFVAVEILHARQGRIGITVRAPWIVALTFGLMHGLGFASGLSEAGLPAGHIPAALLFFSLGVELGHFLFIGAVLSLIALAGRVKLPAPQWAQLISPYAIGSVAMFWVIQRIAAF